MGQIRHLPERVIALDVGGSKIAAALIDANYQIVATQQIETPQSFEGFVAAVAGLVQQLDPDHQVPVGMCMPGYVDPAVGPIAISNIPALAGQPLRKALEERLGVPVRMMNDAQAFLAGAAMAMKIDTRKVVMGAILGTGVGGALMMDGTIMPGVHGIAGEWGQIEWPGAAPDGYRPQWLGAGPTGRIEDWLGARALADLGSQISGTVFTSPRGVIDAIAAGEGWGRDVREIYARRLAHALRMVALLIDPAIVILGGGLSRMPGLVTALMPVLQAKMPIPATRLSVQIAPEAGALSLQGAARLWLYGGKSRRPAR